MEDSSWSGWTTPPPPPGLEPGYPEGRMLPSGPPGGCPDRLIHPRTTATNPHHNSAPSAYAAWGRLSFRSATGGTQPVHE